MNTSIVLLFIMIIVVFTVIYVPKCISKMTTSAVPYYEDNQCLTGKDDNKDDDSKCSIGYYEDLITFESIKKDQASCYNGRCYNRDTLVDYLKENPTDPVSRTPLTEEQKRKYNI